MKRKAQQSLPFFVGGRVCIARRGWGWFPTPHPPPTAVPLPLAGGGPPLSAVADISPARGGISSRGRQDGVGAITGTPPCRGGLLVLCRGWVQVERDVEVAFASAAGAAVGRGGCPHPPTRPPNTASLSRSEEIKNAGGGLIPRSRAICDSHLNRSAGTPPR